METINTKNQYNLFFEGEVSDFFNHKNLYLGDIDFKFADDYVSLQAEIKTISKGNVFTGKKLSFNQAREYACNVDIIDNFKRCQKCYLFEYHNKAKEPYVIVTPFKKPNGMEKQAKDFLDLNKSKMLYIKKENQFNRWLSGDRYVGVKPLKDLLIV